MNKNFTSWVFSALLLSACTSKPLDSPSGPAVVEAVPANWSQDQIRRETEKADYLDKHEKAYAWFARFAFSDTDGDPLILLKLLPVIAPELWGSGDDFLDVVGLFNDPLLPGYPVARGIGLSALARTGTDEGSETIDYTSFSCAACHVGRVRMPSGEYKTIVGGVNTQFNIVQYRVRVYQTLQKIIKGETDTDKKNERLYNAFVAALDDVQKTNPHYFYQGYRAEYINFDADYERRQIELFRKNAKPLIEKFYSSAESAYTSYGALLDKNYSGFQSQSLQGFPGMADATGISTTGAYSALQSSVFTRWFSSIILPPSPGITDFMSVWEQDKRKAHWDAKHERLIDGGGQWNGNVPIPMYRNLAAQLTLGLENNDIRVSAFAVELLDGLPASVYPFDVDIALAEKGRDLFAKNCAQCHQPHNGKVYSNMGTNLDRSYVVNWLIRKGGVDSFYKACSPSTAVDMDGAMQKPCAEFEGVSLKGKKQLIMSENGQHHGYNARPLSGIWAQAPYLHNGSVPTIYHLLVPGERPATFVKSQLDYDTRKLGFAWDTQIKSGEGYLFDTESLPSFSRAGHDQDVKQGTTLFKLDWSDDRPGAMAIIEYLKTL